MEQREKKLRMIDGIVVYMACLLLLGVGGSLLIPKIGLFGILICEVLTAFVPLLAAKRTRLKRSVWLKIEKPRVGQILGAAFLLAAAFLLVIPLILYGQLLVPNFSASCFCVSKQYGASLIWPVILLILIASLSETLLLEGYLYSRLRYMENFLLMSLFIGLLAGIYNFDLYILLPSIVFEVAILKVRRSTSSLALPYVLHLFTTLILILLLQSASYSEKLLGTDMGGLQVTGMALIFVGAAIPVYLLGLLALGEYREKKFWEKTILFSLSVILLASGCGIASLG